MIDPVSSLVFYSLIGLVLLVYNIAAKRAARGFYQLLAGLFGFSVIFYPIGYFTVANRIFGQAISQVTYAWDSISLIGSYSISNLIYYPANPLHLKSAAPPGRPGRRRLQSTGSAPCRARGRDPHGVPGSSGQ